MEDVLLLLDSSQCDGLLVRQLRSLSLRALQPGQRVLQLGSRPRVFVAVDAGTFRGGSILGGGSNSMDTEAGTVLLEPGELRPWLCRSVRRKRRRRWPRRRRPRPLATPSHSAKSTMGSFSPLEAAGSWEAWLWQHGANFSPSPAPA
jgi:hypothetical protein